MKKTVTVVGLGYVGYPLLEALLKSKSYFVFGYDVSDQAVERAQKKTSSQNQKYVTFTTEPSECLPQSDFIIVCVPTPITASKKPDFSPLKSSTKTIARFLKKGQTIIIESTIYPGVCEDMVLPLLEKSGLKGGRDFELSHCPERINPGDTRWTVMTIPRNVGSLTHKGVKKTADFYRSFLRAPVTELATLKEAECTKMVENVFRDVNIAFANELAMSLDQVGIDAVKVIEAASNKPFSFLAHYPGVGVGGDCIATDPYYYIEMLRQYPIQPKLVKLARQINTQMPEYVLQKLLVVMKRRQWAITKTPLAVLGLSYKPGIADLRNSPALRVVELLQARRARVNTFDPHVLDRSSVTTLQSAVSQTPVIILCTAHQELVSKLTPAFLKKNGVEVVVDGRNCLNKNGLEKAGIEYIGVGR